MTTPNVTPSEATAASPRAPLIPRDGRGLLALAAGAALLVALVVGVMLLLRGDVETPPEKALEPGVPTQQSANDLRAFAQKQGHAVFWAGRPQDRKFELTETPNGSVFIRYLPPEVAIGDRRPLFTTVATYQRRGAYATLDEASRATGAQRRAAPAGGVATWRTERPTSVYLAYPGSDLLVEVFDPDARKARALALSGQIGPIR